MIKFSNARFDRDIDNALLTVEHRKECKNINSTDYVYDFLIMILFHNNQFLFSKS